MKTPETWPFPHPVTEERWQRFLSDGDDEIYHTTVVSSCRGQFKVVFTPSGGIAECQKCGLPINKYGPWMASQIYAISPEREPRYKLVEVTAGKNRYSTLVQRP